MIRNDTLRVALINWVRQDGGKGCHSVAEDSEVGYEQT